MKLKRDCMRLFARERAALTGLPTTKMGIWLRMETRIMNKFSRRASFAAMPGPAFKVSETAEYA